MGVACCCGLAARTCCALFPAEFDYESAAALAAAPALAARVRIRRCPARDTLRDGTGEVVRVQCAVPMRFFSALVALHNSARWARQGHAAYLAGRSTACGAWGAGAVPRYLFLRPHGERITCRGYVFGIAYLLRASTELRTTGTARLFQTLASFAPCGRETDAQLHDFPGRRVISSVVGYTFVGRACPTFTLRCLSWRLCVAVAQDAPVL